MKPLIYRQSKMFIIDKTQLKTTTTNSQYNALYAAIHEEFKGANDHPTYSKLNYADRINALNEFALNWAKEKGLI